MGRRDGAGVKGIRLLSITLMMIYILHFCGGTAPRQPLFL